MVTSSTHQTVKVPNDSLLDKAKSLIYGDRAQAYGEYSVEAERLARMWGAFLQVDIRPEQVPAMMVLLKLARLSNDPAHQDSWIDIAGYAGCAGKLESVWQKHG